MRVASSLLFALLVLTCVAPAPVPAGALTVRSSRLAVANGEADSGRLRLRGGLVLDSEHPRFGGLSSIRIAPDGNSLLAITDCGDSLAATIERNARAEMVGVASVVMDALNAGPVPGERDAEGLTREQGGSLLVGFEGMHRAMRYAHGILSGEAAPLDLPPQVQEMPANAGFETVLSLGDGRLLLLEEGEPSCPGETRAFVGKEGAWTQRSFPVVCEHDAPLLPFRATDAALLPGGDVLVLERRYPFLAARLRRISRDELDAGRLGGELVAELRLASVLDNFEGLDVWQTPEGETRVVLLSDDNNCRKGLLPSSSTQRTLLVEYALE